MTVIKEHRVVLPISCAEYQVGQLFSVAEASKDNTGGGEGVEVKENRPYTLEKVNEKGDAYVENGQYTHKIYKMESKVPALIRNLMPKGSLEFHEKAWNAFPYCKTVITNPHYMKDNFECKIETWHKDQDIGNTDNVHQLPPKIWSEMKKKNDKNPKIIPIDIVNHRASSKDYKADADPALYTHKRAYDNHMASPLKSTWLVELQQLHKKKADMQEHVNNGVDGFSQKEVDEVEMPAHMCCYKLVTITFKWKLVGGKIESVGMNQQKRIFTLFHQQLWCWLDRWHGLTMEDIRNLEAKTKEELDRAIDTGEIRGVRAED